MPSDYQATIKRLWGALRTQLRIGGRSTQKPNKKQPGIEAENGPIRAAPLPCPTGGPSRPPRLHGAQSETPYNVARGAKAGAERVKRVRGVLDRPGSKSRCRACTRVVRGSEVRRRVPLPSLAVSRARENAAGRAETAPGIHPAALMARRRSWPALGLVRGKRKSPGRTRGGDHLKRFAALKSTPSGRNRTNKI